LAIEVGQRLLHYRLTAKIGAGGMGEVWSAVDTTLDREVAIKVLPEQWAGDTERLQRFEREAKVVAGLNHPNIVTLHSVQQTEGMHFITMELVHGKPLSKVIPRKGMDLAELLEVALPLTSAVAAAHEKGVAHRDLKPANVMIGDDGRVKVLDFGLAKTGDAGGEPSTQMPTRTVTSDGRILGTAAYMSPEQAEGKPLDRRTDVFSLGIVLYEMAAGRRPFDGETPMSVVTSIMRDEPSSILELNPGLPRHFSRILKRCLAKEPHRRYSSALDLHNELAALKEELDSGELTATPAIAPRRSRVPAWVVPVAVVAVVAAAWFGSRLGRGDGAASGAPEMTIEQLTSDGANWDAAISPDGQYIARVHRHGLAGRSRILLRQLKTGSEVEIVPPQREIIDPAMFSPDGIHLYYRVGSRLLRVPTLGGTPRVILEDIGGWGLFSISPDGTQVAYPRAKDGIPQGLVIAPVEGGEARVLNRPSPSKEITSAGWSPDGETLAFVVTQEEGDSELRTIRIDDASERVLATAPIFGNPVWKPDGSAVLILVGSDAIVPSRLGFVGATEGFIESQVWMYSFPDGEPIRVTRDTNFYNHLTVSADGEALVATRQEWWMSIWIVSGEEAEDPWELLPVQSISFLTTTSLDWIDDDRIVVESYGGQLGGLSVVDVASGKRRALELPGRTVTVPRRVHGKEKLLVHEAVEGRFDLLLLDLQSGALERIAENVQPESTRCAPDGKGVYYLKQIGDDGFAEYRTFDGGEPRRVFDRPLALFMFAEDERTLAVSMPTESGKHWSGAVDLDADERQLADWTGRVASWGWGVFRPGSTSITYQVISAGDGGIWTENLDGSERRHLTPWNEPTYFEWSPDGKRLAVLRRGVREDVVLIRGFDPRALRSR
jgi:Tol biopolymer transport system component/predicted Ser/Thr protein kinase